MEDDRVSIPTGCPQPGSLHAPTPPAALSCDMSLPVCKSVLPRWSQRVGRCGWKRKSHWLKSSPVSMNIDRMIDLEQLLGPPARRSSRPVRRPLPPGRRPRRGRREAASSVSFASCADYERLDRVLLRERRRRRHHEAVLPPQLLLRQRHQHPPRNRVLGRCFHQDVRMQRHS